jgi:hypothetical protein
MRYEVCVAGASIGVFAEAEEALECVRAFLAANPDEEPEIIDMETGHAYEPAATEADRAERADDIGD